MNYYSAKIKYLKQEESGAIKSKSEVYLVDALSFTEGEANLQSHLEGVIEEYNLLALAKTSYADVIFDESRDWFFKVKVSYMSADPDSGKETKITEVYLVQANTTEDATEKIKTRLEGSIVDWEIPSVSKTNVVDCFVYIENTAPEQS